MFAKPSPLLDPALNLPNASERPWIDEVWICASPKAGTGLGREQIDTLVDRLEATSTECHLTGDIKLLQRRVADSTKSTDGLAVVAAGGDGTIALVAQHLPSHVPIVPMPMGTENLLSRHFGFSPLAVDVTATLDRHELFQIDAGVANGRLFLVMISAGMDAEVVRGMHLTRGGHIQKWHYARPILRAVSRYCYPAITAESDERDPVSGCWMMAFNLPMYAGNLAIEPDALADDGWLNLISLRRGSFWHGLHYLARVKLGQHLTHVDVTRHKVKKTRWTSPTRVPYQIDGDYAGRLPVTIELLPQRVTLMRPCRDSSGGN